MKSYALSPRPALAAVALLSVFAVGCASDGDIDAANVAADTIGLARDDPDAWRLSGSDPTIATPYGGDGAIMSCPALARDIVRLTTVLGPDAVPPREDEERAQDAEAEDGGMSEFASDFAEDAPDLAAGAAVDAVVGLNPARPIVRFVSGAGETEAEARRQREFALKRRAWLRGAFDATGCERETLTEALQDAGLER